MTEPQPHISMQFEEELNEVQRHFLEMGGLAEEQLGRAISALTLLDPDTAGQVVDIEKKMDQMEVDVSERCALIFVKRQPAASDLRLVLSINRGLLDLERIGDEACRIARIVTPLSEEKKSSHIQEIGDIGAIVLDMLHQSLDAFVRRDAHTAYEAARRDREVDEQYNSLVLKRINEMSAAPKKIPVSVNLLGVLRALERAGGHVCNICEHVVYMVGGRDVRHQGLKKMKKEAMAQGANQG